MKHRPLILLIVVCAIVGIWKAFHSPSLDTTLTAPPAKRSYAPIAVRLPSGEDSGVSLSDATSETASTVELPFLGAVEVRKQPRNVVRKSGETQSWDFCWTPSGVFVEASFTRAGFTPPQRPYTLQAVYESHGEKIESLGTTNDSVPFAQILKIGDELCRNKAVNKMRIRRVVLNSPQLGDQKQDVYILTIWAADVYPVVVSEGFENNNVRLLLDLKGNELSGDDSE